MLLTSRKLVQRKLIGVGLDPCKLQNFELSR